MGFINNKLWVYHSTSDKKTADYLINGDYMVGGQGGSLYGKGFYCSMNKSQAFLHNYGKYCLMCEVKNYQNVLYLDYNVYRILIDPNADKETFIDNQLELFGLKSKHIEPDQHSSVILEELLRKIQNHVWGVNYWGSFDRLSFVLYKPQFMVIPHAWVTIENNEYKYEEIDADVDVSYKTKAYDWASTLKLREGLSIPNIIEYCQDKLSKIHSKRLFMQRRKALAKVFKNDAVLQIPMLGQEMMEE